jgi:hypothetical protein
VTTFEELRKQFGQLNTKGQRLQHQIMMLTRRLPIARTALEMIAKGDRSPEVLEIAREALNTLNTTGLPEEGSLFSAVPDAQIPPVVVTDLKRYRELVESLAEELDVPADDDHANGSIATHGLQKVVERVCGSGLDAQALWLRNGVLEMLLREGYLAPLQTCMDVPEALLQVFATIPFTHLDANPEPFVERLRQVGVTLSGSAKKQSTTSSDEETRYRRLLRHYRGMSVDKQQLQYEHAVAERKMAIARTALETLANEENAPEVRKLAREALDGFEVSSDQERFMAFFLRDQGAPVHPVDSADLLSVWKLSHEISSSLEGQPVSVSMGTYERACRPGADIQAVWYRTSVLALMAGPMKLLDNWTHDGKLDEDVFRVMADFSVKNMGPGAHQGLPLDVKEFLKQIGKAANPGTS